MNNEAERGLEGEGRSAAEREAARVRALTEINPDLLTNNEHDTIGMRALGRRLDRRAGVTQGWVGQRLGKQQSTVSQWLSGRMRPEAYLRVGLEALLGIPHWWWMTADEATVIKDAAEAGEDLPRMLAARGRLAAA